jgi:hypothetical protein
MLLLNKPLITTLPKPEAVRRRLGETLREVELLRRLLRVAERAEVYRRVDHLLETDTEESWS